MPFMQTYPFASVVWIHPAIGAGVWEAGGRWGNVKRCVGLCGNEAGLAVFRPVHTGYGPQCVSTLAAKAVLHTKLLSVVNLVPTGQLLMKVRVSNKGLCT